LENLNVTQLQLTKWCWGIKKVTAGGGCRTELPNDKVIATQQVML